MYNGALFSYNINMSYDLYIIKSKKHLYIDFKFVLMCLFSLQVFTKDLQKEKNWEIMEKIMQVYGREPEPI